MIKFRTEIKLAQSPELLDLNHPVCTMGSCFADVIGSSLSGHKFKVLVNPMGVTYNPYSIHTHLMYALHNQPIPEHTFLENKGLHFNYNFHSSFFADSKSALSKQLNENIGLLHYFLKDTRWLILTYGTTWTYSRKDTGEIVANCHKQPGNLFDKELLTQKKMIDSFEEFYTELKAFNDSINIILTVSPVRHIKDSLSLNNVSKSVLRLGCHTLSEQHANVHYFPAYEVLMDDLRDYRFYKSDLIHPSEEAETYIWEKFIDAYADSDTKGFIEKWSDIRCALNHKPFHPTSSAHQVFLKEVRTKLETVKSLVNVDKELASVNAQLIK